MDPNTYAETPEWSCKYGHGPLELQQGHFGLQAMRVPDTPAQSNKIPQSGIHVAFAPGHFVLQLWRCRHCGYIELVDRE